VPDFSPLGQVSANGRGSPNPDTVRRYLESNFGDDLKAVWSAMQPLAKAY
jgi:hypothetical protein